MKRLLVLTAALALCACGQNVKPTAALCASAGQALRLANIAEAQGKLSPAVRDKVSAAVDVLWPLPPKAPVCNKAPFPALGVAAMTAADNALNDLLAAAQVSK